MKALSYSRQRKPCAASITTGSSKELCDPSGDTRRRKPSATRGNGSPARQATRQSLAMSCVIRRVILDEESPQLLEATEALYVQQAKPTARLNGQEAEPLITPRYMLSGNGNANAPPFLN